MPSILSNVLGVDMGMFYKRRDYATHRKRHAIPSLPMSSWAANVEGKDVVVIDDMISSGESMIDVATRAERHGKRIVFSLYSTFGLFTNGMEKFDEAL